MLIGLNSGSTTIEKLELAEEIADSMNGETRILHPRDLESLVNVVKSYKPSSGNLILLSTHLEFEDSISVPEYRAMDMLFDNRSGTVWGDRPRQGSISYIADFDEADVEKIVVTASYNEMRSKYVRKIDTQYWGRVSSDPHTLVVGLGIALPKISTHAKYLLHSLPSDGELNWQGFGFTKNMKKVIDLIEWYDSTNVITLGDDAHALLEDQEVEHLALADMKTLYQKTKTLPDTELGRALRELSNDVSRSGETKDERQWRK